MPPPRHASVPYQLAGRFLRLHVTEHGDPAAPVLLCVHGLTRNGRDFDTLARSLSDRYRVVAPDLPGRGGSDWLADRTLYEPASYVAALTHLLAWVATPVDWLGTSLGGICGMAIAATPGHPIRRLILNDIGPAIPAAALARIADYAARPAPIFASLAAAEAYLREVHAPFGPLDDAQWSTLARHAVRQADGALTLNYDPAIGRQLASTPPADTDLWALWNAIDIPMLTLRGETSDVLLPATLELMCAKSAVATIPHTGHAPALMDAPTIDRIRMFLEA